MNLTDKQRKEFEEVTRPLIKWLNDNGHPHVTVIVDNTVAQMFEGICVFHTEEYWKD
ncbi:MAG: hypothetical protein WC455_23910 [Dehalococcoidia bacterium]|jgi:hypothetical protein